jgi:hypothetical protein
MEEVADAPDKERLIHGGNVERLISIPDSFSDQNDQTIAIKKIKTVSGKVSRGGSHDTNGRRPFAT